MNHSLNYWLYTKHSLYHYFHERELPDFFVSRNMYYDSENEWTYSEGYSDRWKTRFNISKRVEADPVLHIIFYFNNSKNTQAIQSIGKELNHYFRVPVHFGIIRKKSVW